MLTFKDISSLLFSLTLCFSYWGRELTGDWERDLGPKRR